MCKMKCGNSCITMSRNCSACGKGGIGMTSKAGGLTQGCAPRQDVRRWSTFVATGCTQESPGRCANVRRGKHPSRQVGRTDKGQPGKPNVRARWAPKEYKTHARPELYASTPPALEVLLSEVATEKRGGKSWRWLTCEGRTSALHHEAEYSSSCRQKGTRQVMNTCAGCCNTACTARVTVHRIGRKSLHRHSATSSRREGLRAHARVARLQQG